MSGHEWRGGAVGVESSALWSGVESTAAALEESVRVDVAIVGGGLAGLAAAAAIRDRNRSVALCERGRIGSGATGATSGILTSQPGFIYDHLRERFSPRAATRYASLLGETVERVSERLERSDIDCGLIRGPSYVYGNSRDRIEREAAAASAAGVPASVVTSVPPFERALAAIRVEAQAAIDPRAYAGLLAEGLAARSGVELFEETRVRRVEPGSPCRLETDEGVIIADSIVLATGFPLVDPAAYFTRLYATRSYLLAVRLGGRAPTGIYCNPADDGRTVRVVADDGAWPLVLVGGERHKTGHGESTAKRYERLESWTRERFPVRAIESRWSVQGYTTADGLPFVGPIGGRAENVFLTTGFGEWGEAAALAAGEVVADSVVATASSSHTPHPAGSLLDPRRVTPTASVPTALIENADAGSRFATDWVRTLLTPDREPLEPGAGRIRRVGREPVAVARDDGGAYHAVLAVCPHRSCLVEWNDAEATWDCPCHGSRFAPDGTWLEGPAGERLPARAVPEDEVEVDEND